MEEKGKVIGIISAVGIVIGIFSDGFGIASHFDNSNKESTVNENNVNVYVSVDGNNNVSVSTDIQQNTAFNKYSNT